MNTFFIERNSDIVMDLLPILISFLPMLFLSYIPMVIILNAVIDAFKVFMHPAYYIISFIGYKHLKIHCLLDLIGAIVSFLLVWFILYMGGRFLVVLHTQSF